MKIKKLSEEITYKYITTTHTFIINGKEVRVYCYDKQDMEQSNYENDTSIDENDIEALTNEEYEAVGELLQDWLDLKVGEEAETTDDQI